jgi:hypothetical protein
MTSNRTNFVYQFTGTIIKKKSAISSPASKYAGQPYYVLTIRELDQTKQSIQVFRSKLAHDSIWTAIEQGTYSGQYVFYCRNQKGYYYLVNWGSVKPKNSEPKENHDLN